MGIRMKSKSRYLLLAALVLSTCVRPVVVDQRPHELDEGALSVSLRTLVVGANGDERPVLEGETLHSGERVFFMVRASQLAYLYVVLFGPDGSANMLFPKDAAVDES